MRVLLDRNTEGFDLRELQRVVYIPGKQERVHGIERGQMNTTHRKGTMQDDLLKEVKSTSITAGTETGTELLELSFDDVNNFFAANKYLVAISFIRELMDLIERLAPEKTYAAFCLNCGMWEEHAEGCPRVEARNLIEKMDKL